MNRAAIDLETLLPLIVGGVWVIAQIVGAAAKKIKKAAPRSAHPPPPPSGSNPAPEHPLEDFLRQFSGDETFRVPEPELIEEVPQPDPAPPPPQPARTDRERISIPEPEIDPPEKQTDITSPVQEIEQVEKEIHPKLSAFHSGIPSFKLPAMPSMSLRVAPPSYAEASHGTQGIGQELHLKDRKALRRAMLSHILFSPPKALERQPAAGRN